MARFSFVKSTCVFVLLCALTVISSSAQTFKTLVNFDLENGANPSNMSLVQGTDGGIYGTTSEGGSGCDSRGCGTVFKISPEGGFITIYSFCTEINCPNGFLPQAGLVLGTDGNFYGTTAGGGANGYGTIFRITPGGDLTTLHGFSPSIDGEEPSAALIQGADGNFYGTASVGGVNGYGTVFRITPGGTFTAIYSFCGQLNCTDGAYPRGALVQATDGNFYGTTTYGGANIYYGTVFRITPDGALTTLHSFDYSDGDYPVGELVQSFGGNLYGTAANGGTGCSGSGCGTIFRITIGGTFTTLHSFDGTDGSGPDAGIFRGNDGNFYGTTNSGGSFDCSAPFGNTCGTIFEMSPGGVLTSLHTFDFTDGYEANGGLLQATNGTFYGTTFGGGTSKNCLKSGGCGTVFSLSKGLGPFVAFVRGAGKIGQSGGVLGQGFTGTTSVSFNGVPANFAVVSDTFLRATVPSGATTGYVTVTTPGGTLTSNVPFQVIQ